MTFPLAEQEGPSCVYRSDRFTPRAFVTHAANVRAEQLAKMDLLPKLKNKVLVTKELAPIFRGREEELKGFTSDKRRDNGD